MNIQIKDIGPKGVTADYNIPSEILELTKEDYVRFLEPLTVRAKVDLVEDTVLIKAKVSSLIETYCSRTLVNVQKNWAIDFLVDFEIDSSVESIDLDEEIRQEVIIRLPVRVLADDQVEAVKEEVEEDTAEELRTYQPFAKLKDLKK